MKTTTVFTYIIAALCLASCASEVTTQSPLEPGGPAKPRQYISLTAGEQAVLSGNNAFAFNLLRTAAADAAHDNLLLSPLSLSLALAMLDNGADGETHDELRTALGFGQASREDINGYFGKITTALREADNYAAFENANSIWIAQNLPVYESFKTANRDAFDAEIRSFDNADIPKAIKQINAWCAAKTRNLIPKLLDESNEAIMYIINALYFKASWTHRFDAAQTAPADFRNADGSTAKIPTMKLTGKLNYAATDGFELLSLPYGNGSFALTLLLPADGTTAAEVVCTLDDDAWSDCLSHMRQRQIILSLPRFKTEYSRTLNEDLKEMNMRSMFTGLADFSRISSRPLFVSFVKQKTFLTVDEEGSEAAAATVIGMLETALPDNNPDAPREMRFDRPFAYFITEESTGSIIFAGLAQQLK
ncbi:MAG: serpin family protein [Tannerella sp.]|jgi:serpin B|nr:serpin family protein [Tannerella sp.]